MIVFTAPFFLLASVRRLNTTYSPIILFFYEKSKSLFNTKVKGMIFFKFRLDYRVKI